MKELYEMLVALIANFAREHGVDTAYKVVKFNVQREALLSLYKDFSITEPSFLGIEKIDQQEKERYWKISYNEFPDSRLRVDACKCFYVIDFLMLNT